MTQILHLVGDIISFVPRIQPVNGKISSVTQLQSEELPSPSMDGEGEVVSMGTIYTNITRNAVLEKQDTTTKPFGFVLRLPVQLFYSMLMPCCGVCQTTYDPPHNYVELT